MRKVNWLLILLLILSVTLSGCGQKGVDDVVGDVKDTLNSLESYKAVGTMKIETSESPQVYSVEVWYKSPHYYRILLNNVNTKITQIVLRNDEGVFVLDPALNKSYRFKSDWPDSNGAVYLFQSIATSILDDEARTFSKEEDNYLFEVKANYQNQNLTKQKIWLDKDVHPTKVTVYDTKETQLVEMEFTEFEFGVKYEDDAFDMERNLTGWNSFNLPAMNQNGSSFGFIEPSYIPEAITKHKPEFVDNAEGKAVVIKYSGKYNYTLIETRPKASIATIAPEMFDTNIVDLGFGIGIFTDMSGTRSLTWTYDGVDFKLQGDLPKDEMVNVARSVFGQVGK